MGGLTLCGECLGAGFFDEDWGDDICTSCNGEGYIDEDNGRDVEPVAGKRRRPSSEGNESTEAEGLRANRATRKRLGKRRKANREVRNRRLNPEFETE